MFNFLVQIGLMIVSSIIMSALAPKPSGGNNAKAANLSEFSAPVAEDGMEIPVVFGTCWMRGSNVLWYGDLKAKPIKQKTGGK